MKIRWTKDALKSLEEIHAYISFNNPTTAKKVIRQIYQSIQQLKQHPLLGRLGRVIGTREFIIPDSTYIAVYRIKKETIEILIILHTYQQYPKIYE